MSSDIAMCNPFSRVTNLSISFLNSQEVSGDQTILFYPVQFHLICEIILLSFIVYFALVTLRSD